MIIRPATGAGNKVIVQDQAGVAVLTTADSGATLANGLALGTPASATLTNATFPAGHIIQINQTIDQSHTTRTGDKSAYASTGVSVTLANELQANSKLLARFSAYTGEVSGGHWAVSHIFTIYQNSTNVVGTQVSGLTADKGLSNQGSVAWDGTSNQYWRGSHQGEILFTPTGTASAKRAVTLYWRAGGTNSFTQHMNSTGHAAASYDAGATILTLMEVAG